MDTPSNPIRHTLSAGEHDTARPTVSHRATIYLTDEAAAIVAAGDVSALDIVIQMVSDRLLADLVSTCEDRSA